MQPVSENLKICHSVNFRTEPSVGNFYQKMNRNTCNESKYCGGRNILQDYSN